MFTDSVFLQKNLVQTIMQSPGKLCLLAVLLAAGCALADDHDCIYGEPPLCQHALASDTTCRGINATTKDAWLSTECDCECIGGALARCPQQEAYGQHVRVWTTSSTLSVCRCAV